MTSTYFTRDEALSKVGKIVKSLRDFAGVPEGTKARVIQAYPAYSFTDTKYGLYLEWIGLPYKDGFSKDEYEAYLQEV